LVSAFSAVTSKKTNRVTLPTVLEYRAQNEYGTAIGRAIFLNA
jgi:hypothetical protein